MNKPTINQLSLSTEKRREAERIQNVLLLLQNLTNNQEATVKLILDCLYDIAYVNLINQKLRLRPLNRLTKYIARMSKPMFRVVAWYWFKRNGPQLITNWLHSQVIFTNTTSSPGQIAEKVAIEVADIQPYLPSQRESINQEVKRLRYQVRLLTGISILAIATLGITVVKLYSNAELIPLHTRQIVQSENNLTVSKKCSSYNK
ncbi:MAG: hypothetical protein VKL59_23320 [Nostocaceae cyanobacterium]|nr:hypothetical protein [Nostocaceae cyanobacterium]